MPKLKLMDDPGVVDLLNKRLGQASKSAHADAMRLYKGMVRSVKESLTTANLDRKIAKALTTHILGNLEQFSPAAKDDTAQAAE